MLSDKCGGHKSDAGLLGLKSRRQQDGAPSGGSRTYFLARSRSPLGPFPPSLKSTMS